MEPTNRNLSQANRALLGVGGSKYFDCKKRYGKVNEHNGAIPRDHWLDESERNAILEFHAKNPLEGYRRLTFMMLDASKRLGKDEGFGELRKYKTLHEYPESIRLNFT